MFAEEPLIALRWCAISEVTSDDSTHPRRRRRRFLLPPT